jgi:hypothetical protein
MQKPHKGRITEWAKRECPPEYGLGFFIVGKFVDHPEFSGQFGWTSYVAAHDEATGEIETRNSRYTLTEPHDASPNP